MTQRYCRNCGAEVQSSDRFCSDCGQELGPADQSDQSGSGQLGDPSDQEWGDSSNEEWGSASTAGTRTQYDDATTGQSEYQHQQGDTTLAAITHVLALFTWLIGPLIVYLVTEDPFVKQNAANAVNWQIMFAIYMIISFILIFVLVGFFLILLLPLVDLAFVIIAALKAGNGEAWNYPLTPKIL